MEINKMTTVEKPKKPYTWEEIKTFLIKELKKTRHILTWGTIGSCNIEHDIDTIITKKPGSSFKSFFKELHQLFDNVDFYLNKKYNSKLICFRQLEPESLILSGYDKNDLAFHTMIYSSYKHLMDDWGSFFEEKKILRILREEYNCLIGSFRFLFNKSFNIHYLNESVVSYLFFYDRINSNYPEERLIRVMNFYYDFLFGKKLGLDAPKAKSKKEVREIFYKLCDILDNLNKKHKK